MCRLLYQEVMEKVLQTSTDLHGPYVLLFGPLCSSQPQSWLVLQELVKAKIVTFVILTGLTDVPVEVQVTP